MPIKVDPMSRGGFGQLFCIIGFECREFHTHWTAYQTDTACSFCATVGITVHFSLVHSGTFFAVAGPVEIEPAT